MQNQDETPLAARVRALEAEVAHLREQISLIQQVVPPPWAAPPGGRAPEQVGGQGGYAPTQGAAHAYAAPAARPSQPQKQPVSSEVWVTRVGVALLVLGVAFLFKYAIDTGFLGQTARVVAGAVASVVLMGLGTWLQKERPFFGQALIGTGLAIGYTSVYAATMFYELVSGGLGFALFTALNVLAVGFAVWLDSRVLAVASGLTAYFTPLILSVGEPNLGMLAGYLSAITVTLGIIVMVRGVSVLVLAQVLGHFATLAIVLFGISLDTVPDGAMTVVVGTLVLAWAVIGVAPLLRSAFAGDEVPHDIGLASALTPLLALWLSIYATGWGVETWGIGSAIVSAVYVALTFILVSRSETAAAVGVFVSVWAAAAAGVRLVDPLAASVIAGGVLWIHGVMAERRESESLRSLVDGLMSIYALGLAALALWSWESIGRTTDVAVSWLDVVSIVMLLGYAVMRGASGPRGLFFAAGWALSLAWLARVLSPIGDGLAIVSVSWAVVTLALLMLGGVLRSPGVQRYGLLTLLLTAGKLVFVDLAEVAALWRILLFMGFGALLLVVGYWLPKLGGVADEDDPQRGPVDPNPPET